MDPWSATADGTVARLAVAGGIVYAGSGSVLQALDAAGGRELWRCDTGTPGPFLAAGGAVYATGGGRLRALDARDGRPRWVFRGAIPVRPAAAGGRVCVIGERPRWGRSLHVLGARNGAEKWRMEAEPKLSAPAAGSEVIVVGCDDGALLGLKARNGKERWRLGPADWHPDWAERGGSVEVVAAADGLVYVAGVPYETPPLGFVAAVDAATGARRWQTILPFDAGSGRPDEGDPPATPGPDGLHVGESGQLTFLDGRTGRSLAYPADLAARYSPPVVVGDVVCAGTRTQRIEAYDTGSGDLLWRLQDPLRPVDGAPVPVAADPESGRLFAGGHRTVYALDARTGDRV